MQRLMLTNGEVIDGTGAPRRRAEVVVEADTIAAAGAAPPPVVARLGRKLEWEVVGAS